MERPRPDVEPAPLSSPITEGPPAGQDTLEVPTDAFKLRRDDPDRFVLETADAFHDTPIPGRPTLEEVKADHFQILPGLERYSPVEAALLAVRGTSPENKIFLFAKEKVRFGRQASVTDPSGREIKVDMLLRALPCRSKEKDPENYKKNLTISRLHAAFRVDENQLVLENHRRNQGLAVEGKPVPSGKSLRLPETSTLTISQNALQLDVRIFPTEDTSQMFRIFGEPPTGGDQLLGMGGRSRIECVRIERPSNAPIHRYLLLVRSASIGEEKGNALRIPHAGPGTRLYLFRRELFLEGGEGGAEVSVDGRKVSPGFLAPLSPGAIIHIGSAQLEFRLPDENDFKTL
jgi:hypothetical protein